MIFLWLIIDILINNYTKFTSFFFIIYLYNKSYKYYLYLGIILDFIIFNTYFYNIIIFTIIYLMNKPLKELNMNNIWNYIFVNIYNYLLYIIFSNLFVFNNLNHIFLSIGNNLIINIIFYILSFRIYLNKKV